jgi:transcriptional regulator with XRE-family HTH domain
VPEIHPPERAPTLLFVPKQKRKSGPSFGDRIRQLRKVRGVSQGELANQIGLSRRMVVYYETQGGSPSPELVLKFARALGVSCEVLLGEKDPARRSTTPPVQLEDVRLLRRFRRLRELPLHDRKTVLKMIDALADRAVKRRVG